MSHVVTAIIYVWLIINIVPFVVYGIAARFANIQTPGQVSTQQFMLSVFLEKFGVATTFAVVFLMGDRVTAPNWLFYGMLWWYMAALAEVATAMRGGYGWKEAVIGIVSELIYFPLAAYTMAWLITP